MQVMVIMALDAVRISGAMAMVIMVLDAVRISGAIWEGVMVMAGEGMDQTFLSSGIPIFC